MRDSCFFESVRRRAAVFFVLDFAQPRCRFSTLASTSCLGDLWIIVLLFFPTFTFSHYLFEGSTLASFLFGTQCTKSKVTVSLAFDSEWPTGYRVIVCHVRCVLWNTLILVCVSSKRKEDEKTSKEKEGYRMVFASICDHASTVFIFANTSIWQIFLASSEHFRKQKACGADEIW